MQHRRKPEQAAYLTSDLADALALGKKLANDAFGYAMDTLEVGRNHITLQPESKDALLKWFMIHGQEWQSELERAWCNGRYDAPHLSSQLQRLRNSEHGHELVYKLGKVTPNIQR